MSESTQQIDAEPIHLKDLAETLPQTRIFASTPFNAISGIDKIDRVTIKAGTVLVEAGQPWLYYWVVLSGEMRAERPESGGAMTMVGMAKAGEGFGEVPFLNGYAASTFRVTAVQDSVLLRFSEQDFWSLLACCPEVQNCSRRQRRARAGLSG
jgi:CRP-like cAMP-binding protein